MNDNDSQNVGLTKAISIIYLIFSFGMVVAIVNGSKIGSITLNIKEDIWFPILIAVIAIATIRRTKWGRWLSYMLSFFVMLGVPIGTFLGGFMVWHLTKYRASFNKWY
jgi:hypothetical protein